MNKKILILYTSVGLGHKTIAENIGFHLEQAGHTVKLFDVFELQSHRLVHLSIAFHQFINRRWPFIWRWLYRSNLFTEQSGLGRLRIKTASKNYHRVKQVIDDFQPYIVITTQTSASAVIEFLKQQGWYQGLFVIAFSDYHLHRYWLYPSADLYLANIEEQKQEMIKLGVRQDKIAVCGITLKPKREIDAAAAKSRLGLSGDAKVILIASGSLGTGLTVNWYLELIKELEALDNTRVVIICGKNRALKDFLQQKIVNDKTTVLGYYAPMDELYAISDIFLTKPGGLTVAETLQWRLPLLITHWLPGQEEINYHYLVSKQIVMPKPKSVEPKILLPIIVEELSHQQFRESLISNSYALELTQSGTEGERIITAINTLFHKFDR
jgi:processive 1,2-diacylglycerol beta-glucosyltransferase